MVILKLNSLIRAQHQEKQVHVETQPTEPNHDARARFEWVNPGLGRQHGPQNPQQ